jgi:hypothetical protein
MKLIHLLDRLSNGAVLHLSLAKGCQSWELHDGITVIWIGSRTAQAAIKRGAIIGSGDTLFPDVVPSQTWRITPSHPGDRS